MPLIYGGFGLVLLALWIFCLFDVIVTAEEDCRNLPKGLWIMIVLFLPEVGSILWLVAGRPQTVTRPGGLPYKGNTGRFPEYDRPGRFVPSNPGDDEEFLRRCRERAEEQRRAYLEQQRQAEKNQDQ
ncbi:PLDc N-terminal domain-containing protein [Microbispora sp. NPDC046973]|uniref:PLDc N-terminal domain-containing protein n=1 Tax=Microbispora sp. NPDC046973 TaxID=3155022 RepID=UPI0033C0ECF4